jgi:PleD family two-component response regulator
MRAVASLPQATAAESKGHTHEQRQQQRQQQPQQQPKKKKKAPYSNLRILIADDNKVNSLVLQRMLRQLRYRADVVTNGQQCIDTLRANIVANLHVDVLFMDISMPVMDGLEATRRYD